MAEELFKDEDIFIFGSMQLPLCNITRAGWSLVLREDYDSSPVKGYSDITKKYFYGYKLHLINSLKGVYT